MQKPRGTAYALKGFGVQESCYFLKALYYPVGGTAYNIVIAYHENPVVLNGVGSAVARQPVDVFNIPGMGGGYNYLGILFCDCLHAELGPALAVGGYVFTPGKVYQVVNKRTAPCGEITVYINYVENFLPGID